ncbi:hypothetical protein I6I98_13220 [Sphingobacterium multivorum]|uniref:SPOR domain-containing protein n=1 Tax=Sphingobacterium multivorum TaxID=28454 RepID=A0ABX7CVP5_SPHMU|nr:hypothetical protein [Sphingobacterium multivorum]QQT56161.1 hypothetical protein I6I98_13220 [Sphingobacterium multivorum]
MKKIIILMLVCLWAFQDADAQTYLQGYNVISLSEAATCDLLPQSNRLTTDQAFEKLKQVDPDPVKKSSKDMNGESWWLDDMLVTIVTRRISAQNPKEDLLSTQKSNAPEILYREGTTPDRTAANDYFSEIKSVNNFDVLIDYFKTRSNYKSFLIQDKEGKFKIMGTIYVKKQDATKAHALINTILNKLSFK